MANVKELQALADQEKARADKATADLATARSELAQLQAPRVDVAAGPAHYRVPKIPAFYTHDPAFWFDQVEAAFIASHVTSPQTKAAYLMSYLSGDVAICFRDLLPLGNDPETYEAIKTRIISTYAASSKTRIRQLLKGQVPTDGKP